MGLLLEQCLPSSIWLGTNNLWLASENVKPPALTLLDFHSAPSEVRAVFVASEASLSFCRACPLLKDLERNVVIVARNSTVLEYVMFSRSVDAETVQSLNDMHG